MSAILYGSTSNTDVSIEKARLIYRKIYDQAAESA